MATSSEQLLSTVIMLNKRIKDTEATIVRFIRHCTTVLNNTQEISKANKIKLDELESKIDNMATKEELTNHLKSHEELLNTQLKSHEKLLNAHLKSNEKLLNAHLKSNEALLKAHVTSNEKLNAVHLKRHNEIRVLVIGIIVSVVGLIFKDAILALFN
ncbi:hypothetical protein AB3Y13_18550 [Vibrio alginolyticus]